MQTTCPVSAMSILTLRVVTYGTGGDFPHPTKSRSVVLGDYGNVKGILKTGMFGISLRMLNMKTSSIAVLALE